MYLLLLLLYMKFGSQGYSLLVKTCLKIFDGEFLMLRQKSKFSACDNFIIVMSCLPRYDVVHIVQCISDYKETFCVGL